MPFNMFKFFLFFVVIIFSVKSLPLPQNDNNDLELLSRRETRYHQFPFFWFGRPVNGDDYDDPTNNGPSYNINRRSSTVSYINVGSGWGR